MAKPAKPSFGTNANVPSSKLSGLADLADYAANPPAVIASRAAVQSIPSAVATAVIWDTKISDNAGMYTASSASISIVDAGFYAAYGWVDVAAGTTGIRQLEIVQNGTTAVSDARSAQSALTDRMAISGLLICSAGDTLQLWVYQSQGTALNLTAARYGVVRVSG